MKVWYIIKTHGEDDIVIKTSATTHEEIMKLMHEEHEKDPSAAIAAGFAEDQDGIPDEYEDIAGMILPE